MKLVRPKPFIDVWWAFLPVDVDDGDEDEDPDPEGDEPFADSSPVMSAGDARFDTGGPGKMYGAPGENTFGSYMPGSLSLYAPGKRTV